MHWAKHMITVLAAVVWNGTARAHVGFESETEARIFSDRMELCFRCSPSFAWRMMGEQAPPPGATDAEQVAKPILEELARDWVKVSSGGQELVPLSARCVFEVDGHVAVLLRCEKPEGPSLAFRLTFFDKLGDLDWSKIRVYDQTKDPLDRTIEPFAGKELFKAKPYAEFDLPSAAAAEPPEAGNAVPAPPSSAAMKTKTSDPWRNAGLILASALAALFCAVLARRWSQTTRTPG